MEKENLLLMKCKCKWTMLNNSRTLDAEHVKNDQE